MKVKNIEVIEKIRLFKDEDSVQQTIQWLKVKTNTQFTDNNLSDLKKQLLKLKYKLTNVLKNCKYNWDLVEKKHQQWLLDEFKFDFVCNEELLVAKKMKSTQGTSRKLFADKAPGTQAKEILKIVQIADGNLEILLRAAHHVGKKQARHEIAVQIEKILEPACEVLEPNDVLSLYYDNRFSKSQYFNTRKFLLEHQISILPSYYQLLKFKKQSHPDGIVVTETVADVPVQKLFDHTAQQLLNHCSSKLITLMTDQNLPHLETELIFSWGFDGSSGQSQYNMRLCGQDSSLFCTTLIPLQLSSSNLEVIWGNPAPASSRFVRPIRIEFAKEDKHHVLKTQSDIQGQIDLLQPKVVKLSEDFSVSVHAKFHLTLIDGKCLAIVTQTPSMASCPLCKAKPSQMNERDNTLFQVSEGALRYGISPLHFAIRALEGVLNLSYRLKVKKWSAGKIINERKREIQGKIRDVFNVIVDMPRDGGAGTSNTGNVARKLFSEPIKFASALELPVQMITDFRTVIVALNCHQQIDSTKLQKVCNRISGIYKEKFPWARPSSSIHKTLAHASEIIKVSPLPLGIFSEEGAESKNKDYRNDRQHHARKCGRKENLEDIFLRSMESSDPLISMISSRRKKSSVAPSLPPEVQELLVDHHETVEEDDEYLNFDSEDLELQNEDDE